MKTKKDHLVENNINLQDKMDIENNESKKDYIMENNNTRKIVPTHSKGILQVIRERPKISKDLINQRLNSLHKTDKEAVNKKTLLDSDVINFDPQTNVEIDTTSIFSNSTYSRICKIKQSFEQNPLVNISNNNSKQEDSMSHFAIKEKENTQSLQRRLSTPRKLSVNQYNGYNYNFIKKQPYRRYSDSFDLNMLPKVSSQQIKREDSVHHSLIKDNNNLNEDTGTVTTGLSLNPTSSTKFILPNNNSLLSHLNKIESMVAEPMAIEPNETNMQSIFDFNLRASPEPESDNDDEPMGLTNFDFRLRASPEPESDNADVLMQVEPETMKEDTNKETKDKVGNKNDDYDGQKESGDETDFDDINENSMSEEVNHELEVKYDDNMNGNNIITKELKKEEIEKRNENIHEEIKENNNSNEVENKNANINKNTKENSNDIKEKNLNSANNNDEIKEKNLNSTNNNGEIKKKPQAHKYGNNKEGNYENENKKNIVQNNSIEDLKYSIKKETSHNKDIFNMKIKEEEHEDPLQDVFIKNEEKILLNHDEYSMKQPTSMNIVKPGYDFFNDKNEITNKVKMETLPFKGLINKKENYSPVKSIKLEETYPNEANLNDKLKTEEKKYLHPYSNKKFENSSDSFSNLKNKFYSNNYNYSNKIIPSDETYFTNEPNNNIFNKTKEGFYEEIMLNKRNLSQTSLDYDLYKKRRDNDSNSVLILNHGSGNTFNKINSSF